MKFSNVLNEAEGYFETSSIDLGRTRGSIAWSIAKNLLANGMLDKFSDPDKMKKYIIFSVLPHRICFRSSDQKLHDMVEEVWEKKSIKELKDWAFSKYQAGRNHKKVEYKEVS